MSYQFLSSDFAVSGQIDSNTLAALVGQGFSDVICNRPDGESDEQPSAEQIAASAADCGLTVHYVPVIPGQFKAEDAISVGRIIASAKGKVLGYCRTGNRSSHLWAIDQLLRGVNQCELEELGQRAGFDLSQVLTLFNRDDITESEAAEVSVSKTPGRQS
ncbi:TIGR01244 family sulfur transferase [Gilvimarinus sp. 1_MG-2023]|uniref:TIGR01244 family sulfur transferase n=1 Tax=Gilvimarinus sp. 1_MG-2023 TaxID=3062638 RepID=UPI0026E3CA6A|nr:TIGR01244 family sulfur transferase [Gilvimarinus sp. 1_MG-2023]MDO6746498.1 TIGR01244 family sulfur transferase [Gilvimarinus sp. 1_MG-2023]